MFVWHDCVGTVCVCSPAHYFIAWIGLNWFAEAFEISCEYLRPPDHTYWISPSAIGIFILINKLITNIEMEFLACLWHPYVNLSESATINDLRRKYFAVHSSNAKMNRRVVCCAISTVKLQSGKFSLRKTAKGKVIPISVHLQQCQKCRLSTAELISLFWMSACHVKYVNINRLTI